MQNTQLYPVVEIDGTWYSTNNVTIEYENVQYYCKPILMNIPSIKESVDIESRRFKISNVSLQFNNFPFEGFRFSDQLSETSLINKETTIYFKSQSNLKQVYKGIIRRLSHDDEKVSIDLEDLTEKKAHKDLPQSFVPDLQPLPENRRNKEIPIVYGEVDRSPAVLTLYDENDLESEYSIKADSRDIHGYVGDNPLLINNDDIYVNVLREAKEPNSGTVSFDYQDPLQYEEIGDEILFRVNPTDYNDEDENVLGNPLGDGLLVVSQIERPLSIEALQYESETDIYGQSSTRNIYYSYIESPLTENDGFHIKGVMARGHRDDGSWDGSVPNSPTVEQNSMWGDFEYPAPDSFIFDRGLFGCFIKMPTFASFNESQGFILSNFWSSFYNRTYIGEGTSGVNYRIRFGGASSGDYPPDAPYQDNGGENTQTGAGTEASPNGLPNSGTTHNSLTGGDNAIKIDFVDKLHFHMSQHSGSYAVAVGQVEFFDHIEVHNQGLVKDFIKQDFYANVKGRVNTFDDHPKLSNFYTIDELIGLMLDWEASFYEGSINAIQDEFDSLYEDLVTIQEQDDPDYFPEGFIDIIINDVLVLLGDESTFIQNPIDIIYDLVRGEIGHDNIDLNEYIEARDAHADWKFAFTVNKKISSKKLIEDIAKSTKCFPKFKNDGSFGFNTVKDSYTVEGDNSDYAGATPIKESEVISYSFKKTKPEQIYKKVTVSYNKDYAQDSYTPLAPIDLGADDYYGIEDSADAHLEFESDYIRDEETADLLASFLSEQYKNDHLIFNLKLPLQYIDLEIGDLVKFENLFQGVAAYGIDYTDTTEVNGQTRYPLFMVTSTTKNLDSISIECMQLHHLEESIAEEIDYVAYDGDDIEISGNIELNNDNQSIAILVNDSYDYSGLLGDSQYFKISGIERPVLPESGDGDIVSVTHIYNSNEDSPNHFILTWVDETDGQLSINSSASFGLADDEQITITLSSYDLPASSVTGDVNLDGGQSILDIVQMVNYTLGDLDLNQQQLENADINNDSIVNILDIVQLVNLILED